MKAVKRARHSLHGRLAMYTTVAVVLGLVAAGVVIAHFLRSAVSSQAEVHSSGFWRTSGNRIVDSLGNTVRITGVNWFGLEEYTYAPHGLWARDYKGMIDQMSSLGYNTIRLPFSNSALRPGVVPNGIDFSNGSNRELRGLTTLQIMDKIIEYAGLRGMKVILDRHRPTPAGQSDLWYTDQVPESQWIADWKMLAQRYRNNPTVIGADLHNEPHGNACWGCGDPRRDWRLAAERAGNEILSVHPEWLIFVEGVENYNGVNYWWGGNLMGVRDYPVRLNVPDRLVYSTHDYPESVYAQAWFYENDYPANLPRLWDRMWGYIHKQNIAPVYVGEFGTKHARLKDIQWFDAIIAYLGTGVNGMHWTFWSWNPNSGDTGGILGGNENNPDDWVNVHQDKHRKLSTIQSPFLPGSVTGTISYAPSRTPSSTVVPPTGLTAGPTMRLPTASTPLTVQPTAITTPSSGGGGCAFTITNQWQGGFLADVTVRNTSSAPLTGWTLTWTFPSGQTITNLWNGVHTQSGNAVMVRNASWNGSIPVNGSVAFGFQGSGTAVIPTDIRLNGAPCGGGVPTAIPSSPTRVPSAVPTAVRTPTSPPTASRAPTSAPSTTRALTATPTTGSRDRCAVVYDISSQWDVGFTANLVVTNNTGTAINGWVVSWEFPSSQMITHIWNGTHAQTGRSVLVRNMAYNAIIPDGGSVSFGFNGSYTGTNIPPSQILLNGVPCVVR